MSAQDNAGVDPGAACWRQLEDGETPLPGDLVKPRFRPGHWRAATLLEVEGGKQSPAALYLRRLADAFSQLSPAPAPGLSAQIRALPPWKGDLQDDCSLEVDGLLAHTECMGEFVAYDPQDKKDKWAGESWFLAVYRGKETIFHSGEPGGSFSSGELARAVAETIIRAELAAAAEARIAELERALGAVLTAFPNLEEYESGDGQSLAPLAAQVLAALAPTKGDLTE